MKKNTTTFLVLTGGATSFIIFIQQEDVIKGILYNGLQTNASQKIYSKNQHYLSI